MVLDPKIITLDDYHRVVEAKLSSEDFKIVSLEESRLEQRVGFLADHSRVLVEVERPGGRRQTLTFFAKALPSNENCRAMIEENGSFEREIFFYEVLSKHFDRARLGAKTFPTCYLSKPEVLILEDLGALGFGPVKSTFEAVDSEHCYQVLAALARFHSASIQTEEKLQKRLQDVYPEHMYEIFFTKEGRAASWWRMGLQGAAALLPLLPQFKEDPATAKKLQAKFQGLEAKLLQSFEIDPRRRNVMCHGDSWISNFLFKHQQGKPDQAVLLDFQVMRYAPPVYDVQLFLHKSLPYTDNRAHQMTHLLQFYYKRLQSELCAAGLDAGTLLPEEEFRETSKAAAVMASIAVVLYGQTCDLPVEFIDMLFADQHLYNKYMFQDRPEYVTKMYHTDKHFRFVMENAIGNLAKVVMAVE